ncbi:PilN domain-containing protein [Bacteriovorax sp. PP10]|uniref:PilN domain-containing protein n=1 Tax=Bacteriovorax antarcticus TaxID=3088717 RepID=A0ABU5VSM6_9BACT|nr:PilN domain-containing protein [Bacteriovorax sp. PP10]MEA9354660.1 PilN domain-containing protein [Bacteriovorax sp. PP10]
MIELNLLEKKQPVVLPTILGIDLNNLNLKMLGVALVIYYLPSVIVSSVYSERTTQAEEALQTLTSQATKIKAALDKDANIKSQVDAYKLQVSKLQSRSTQVDEILKTRTNPKKILEKVARSIPEDVWFNRMSINEKNEISIEGGSYTPRAVGEFITNINDSPYFGGSVTPVRQENRKDNLDGVSTNYEVFELKGKIINYDMRSK